MSRTTDRQGSKSLWKKKDAAYRAQERQRRQANRLRKQEVAEAAALGIDVQQWRTEKAERAAL